MDSQEALVAARAAAADVTPVTPWYLDKAVYAAVLVPLLTPLLAWVNAKLGTGIDANWVVLSVVLPVVTYIAAHKWKSGTIAASQVAAGAATQNPAPTLNK